MKKTKPQGGIYTVKPDGRITDKGVVDGMLQDEDRLRQELIDAGVIDNIVLKRNNKKIPKGGIFCTEGADSQLTDKGIVDEMLENDALITRQLTEAGVIKQYYVKDKED